MENKAKQYVMRKLRLAIRYGKPFLFMPYPSAIIGNHISINHSDMTTDEFEAIKQMICEIARLHGLEAKPDNKIVIKFCPSEESGAQIRPTWVGFYNSMIQISHDGARTEQW